MRNRNIIILGAVLVGLLYIGPPLMIWKYFSKARQPFVLAEFRTYRDSLMAYLPRAHEVFDGHFPPGELYAAPLQPTIQNLVPSLLFGGLIFLFSGNMNLSYLAAQFIFSGIIFAFFYLIGWSLFRSRPWSLLLGLVGTITPIAVKLPFYKWHGWWEFQVFFINNFIPFTRTQLDQLFLTRVDEPLLTYPFYLAAILSFFIFWQQPSRFRAIITGATAGLVFYVYFHHWVYWTIFLGVMFLYTLLFGRGEKKLLQNFFLLWSVLIIVAVPYFINYFRFQALPTAQDFSYREGVIYGRQLGLGSANIKDYIFYIFLAVSAYLLYWKKNRSRAILFLGLIAAMFLAWNVQLVVGFSPIPHFFQRSFSPVIFLILFSFIYDLSKQLERRGLVWKKAVMVILVFLISSAVIKKSLNIVSIASAVQPEHIEYYRFPSDLVESWEWINANLGKEPVVISPSTMESMHLNTYTSVRPYLPTAFVSLLSTEEIERRFLVSHKLFGVSEKVFEQRLLGNFVYKCSGWNCVPDEDSNLNDSLWHIYGDYWNRAVSIRELVNGTSRDKVLALKSKKITELEKRYHNTNVQWSDIGSGYVYAGPWESYYTNPSFSQNKELTLVYSNSSVKIYRINNLFPHPTSRQ